MELDEFIKGCRNPDSLAKFISAPGDGIFARFWDDFTIDISVSYPVNLRDYLASFRCPICGADAPVPCQPTETVRGMFSTCPECSQPYFIHERLPFGGTPE